MDAEGVGIRCRRRIAAERRTFSDNDSPTPFRWFRLCRAGFNPWLKQLLKLFLYEPLGPRLHAHAFPFGTSLRQRFTPILPQGVA